MVENVKAKMLDAIKDRTSLTLEKLNKSDNSGTRTGNVGRGFFFSKIIPFIVELVPVLYSVVSVKWSLGWVRKIVTLLSNQAASSLADL